MLKRATVGGLTIAYDDVGTGGRPFVMVHGFTGSRDDFADNVEAIAKLGRTLVPDLRGHGDTTNPGRGYSLDQLTADLLGFLDAIEVGKCDLLGHSLGGMIALRFVLAHPERVASLILMDTAARSHLTVPKRALIAIKWLTRHIPMRWHWRVIRANRKRLPDAARRAETQMGSSRYWERIRAKLVAMDPVAFDELLTELTRQEPVADRLHEIGCPTRVIVGADDAAFLRSSREMADTIPNADLIVIDDAHHSPQIEAPQAWHRAVQEHLNRVRA
jgi:pimeloyl-ACP methyl ester carboxylesterase